MMRISRLINILILFSLSLNISAQALTSERDSYFLLTSGKKKVIVLKNNILEQVWIIDSSANTVEKHLLVLTALNPIAPIFDSLYSTQHLEKSFFDKNGNIDSIISINYNITYNRERLSEIDTIIDSTIVKYNYQSFDNWPMNREFYNISKGLKKKNKTDYFGYDTKKRIILLIQDEGRVQFYYTYNDKEQIITETVLGVTIVYEYDTLGRKVKRSSKTQKIKYEYYKNSLLEREVIDGSNGGIWNYLYE